jgi:hypothetical protein
MGFEAVPSDLDDTRFDHRNARRTTLGAIRSAGTGLDRIPVARLHRLSKRR